MSDTFPIHRGQKEVIFNLALNMPIYYLLSVVHNTVVQS